jgi:hypothetical protein
MDQRSSRYARLAFLGVLALYGVASLRSPGDGRLLDNVDLAIHETGHLVFAPFGEFLTMLGGTLFQLLLPATFVVYFLRRKERFGAAVCLWWVAQNCWNISVYIADARAQELPLVGGGEHDWFYLLSATRSLESDLALSRIVHGAGVLIFGAALALGLAATLVTPAPPTAAEPELDTAH